MKEIFQNCAYNLRINDTSPFVVEKELELHYPHGDLIDTKIMKHALKLFGRSYSTTGEVLHVFKFLQHVVDHVPQGLLDGQVDDRSRIRSAVADKKRYPLWRDMVLVIAHCFLTASR